MEIVKEKFKASSVGKIPIDWDVKNIVENSSLKARIGWQGLTTAEYLDSGNYFLVTGTDFQNGKIQWETCHYVSSYRFIQDKNIQLRIKDILITKDGTIGKIAFIDNLPLPATLNSGVFVIRPKNDEYVPIYLYYLFNSLYFLHFLKQLVAGSTINHLYQKDFVTFKFPLPPTKAEQTAIATALSDTDNYITHLEKLIAKKRLIKQGAMQELLRPKEGWVVKKLGEIGIVIRGASPRPQGDKRYYGGNVPRLMVEDVTRDGKFVTPKVDFLTEEGAKRSRPCKAGTLTIVCSGTVGIPAILEVDACIHDGFLALTKVLKEYSNDFLYHQLTTMREDFEQSATHGGVFTNLTTSVLKEFEVAFPNFGIQTQIAAILSDMDSDIAILQKKLSKVQNIKLGMMQQLLTGKIRLI